MVDVGCGTGVLAHAALNRGGQVIGIDPNPGMLAVARHRSPAVTWLDGVAEQLPLDTASADVVASQFALMFFVDPAAAITEMRRVLRPGGRLVIATWAQLSTNPGYAVMVDLIRRVVGGMAADALRAPFSVGTSQALRNLVAPEFPDVHIETHTGRARFPSLEAWLTTEIKAWTLEALVSDQQLSTLLAEAPRALGQFTTPTGAVTFDMPALIASARVPKDMK